MKSRKKRIAVFLVVALFIGIACPYNQREIKEMKAVEIMFLIKMEMKYSRFLLICPDKTRW